MKHALVAAALLLGACQSGAPVGRMCIHTSECTSGLVCRFGACRVECTTNADCSAGATCLLGSDGTGACGIDTDLGCLTGIGRQCATGLVCVSDRCERPCASGAQCPSDGLCLPIGDGTSFCFDPRGSADAGLSDVGARDGGVQDGGGQTNDAGAPDVGVDAAILRNGALDACVGAHSACVISADRRVYCWGQSDRGQLGFGDCHAAATTTPAPMMPVAGVAGADAIACGTDFACAHLADGTVWCWGANDLGQLGRGAVGACDAMAAPVIGIAASTGLSGGGGGGAGAAIVLAAAGNHACVLDPASNTLLCWGANDFVIDGTSTVSSATSATDASAPLLASSYTPALGLSTLALGPTSVCILTDTAVAYCWGDDAYGQLGVRHAPPGIAQTPAISSPVALSAGDAFFCAIDIVGEVFCWGDVRRGALSARPGGIFADMDCGPSGTDPCTATPSNVATYSLRFSAIASSGSTTCAVVDMRASAGEIVCWGVDTDLQAGVAGGADVVFGDKDPSYPMIATTASTVSGASAVAMGATAGCAIDVRGALSCWGNADLSPSTAESELAISIPIPMAP